MLELAKLIDLIVGFASPMVQSKLQRSELVIKLLKQLHLNPDHPPADFTAVYQYTLVEYGIGKPKPVLEIFRQAEIQALFRKALDQNHPSLLLKEGETFLSGHSLGDQIQALGIDARQEFYQFAAVFIEVAKRTRTPAEVLANQRLESLHRQIGSMQERLHRLPTLEAMRTEMARLAAQGYPLLPGAIATPALAQERQLQERQCRAFALAQQMKGWFETLGYRFESYEVWQDDYFEWIIDIPVRRGRYDRILVRGVDGEVGLGDIKALRQSVETQRADEGWLVTARRISRAAREAVEQEENHDLGCYTFDELLDQDADFGGYLDWLEAEIGRRGIDQKYVPLACTKEEVDPDTKQRLGVSRYDDRDGWIDGYIDLWLDDPAKEHISVLGEFGTGKTWFALHYASQALKRYREAQQRGVERPRLPLVIPLRDYAKAVSVESLFSEFFFRKHEVRSLTYSAFEQLNRMGKLLLIFDGFDEMAARVDRQEMINNFWELAKVVVPGAKVILTCRTEHFPEAREGRALLNAQLQASTANLTGEMPQFEVLELEKFNDAQIREVMLLQAESATVEQVMSNPQLLDLARRPVMTELILEALPDIEAGKPVDMSRVYLYAVRRKMERDIKEERTFTSLAEKLYFLCELSWEMLSSDRMSLNYREFPDRIRCLFGSVVQEEKDLDHWHYDMMGQTMLIRNADGDYMPAHRSLLEFFVAYKFAAELGVLSPDFLELAQAQSYLDTSREPQNYTWSGYFQRELDEAGRSVAISPLNRFSSEDLERLRIGFGQRKLTKAVLDLMVLILFDPFRLVETLKITYRKTEAEVGYVGGNIATLLVKSDKAALADIDLSHTVIKGADFKNANLHQLNLTKATVKDSEFTEMLSQIFSVAFHPSGNLMATGDAAGEVRLWEFKSRKLIWSCKEHTHILRSLSFSPDGQKLASASLDCTIKLWQVSTGSCLITFKGHVCAVRSVSFSPDSKMLASGAEDQTIKIWDVLTGKCIRTLTEVNGYIRSVVFSPNGKLLAHTGESFTVKVWDVDTWQSITVLRGHSEWVKSIAFSPDSQILASSSQDYTVKLWNVYNGECLQTLSEHPSQVNCVVFANHNGLLASGSSDHTIKLWNIESKKSVRTLKGHSNWIQSIAFSPDSTTLISGAQDHTVRLWDVKNGDCLDILQGHSNWIKSVSFSPDGKILAGSCEDKLIRLWDTTTGDHLREMHGHTSWVHALSFNSLGSILASSGNDKTIRLWDVYTGKCLNVLQGHTQWIGACTFSPDDQLLASGSDDTTIRVWEPGTGRCIRILNGHTRRLRSVVFSTDSQALISCGHDDTIRFWDVFTGECTRVLQTTQLRSAIFSSDRTLCASGGVDYHIHLWDLTTGQYIDCLQGHTGQVKAVSFSPNGHLLASGSDDLTVRLWDLRTRQCLHVMYGHYRTMSSIAFHPDGRVFVSCGEDGSIKFWNTETGECLKTLTTARPYEGMNITGVKGLTEAEKATLKALGAIEDE